MVVVDGLLRSGRGNGATVEVFLFFVLFFGAGLLKDCWVARFDCWGDGVVGFFFFFFATMVCGCGRWWFKLKPRD